MKKRKSKRKKFRARSFQLWLSSLAATIVKFRDGYICQIGRCNNKAIISDPYNCQWVHIYTRNAKYVKWDAIDAICGCGACHYWAHQNPDEFIKWFKDKYPDRYAYLNQNDGYGVARRNETLGSWDESIYLMFEDMLMQLARRLEMPYHKMPERYQKRYKQKYEGLKNG